MRPLPVKLHWMVHVSLREGFLLMVAAFLSACGGGGEADAVACAICGPRTDIRGSISSQNGSQAQMAGWVVAAFEKETGIARVAEIDAAGLLTFQQVRTEKTQTLALFSPDYIVRSVLSIPNDKAPSTIKQFFQIKSPNLPKIIHKGATIGFQDFNGITVTKDLAGDDDSDGVPNGYVSIDGDPTDAALIKLREKPDNSPPLVENFNAAFALQGNSIDRDTDGTPNQKDPDIDGDGVINWLDPDDDGDAIRDPFDGDQNGDLENDASPGQEDIDLYFKEGIEYLAVQFELKPADDGTSEKTTLKFTTKVRDDVTPIDVKVRGAPSLLKGATYIARDENNQETILGWNGQLQDDGLSEDNNAGDRIFAKKIQLESGKKPRLHEIIFVQLVFANNDKYWSMEFPYTFPDLSPSGITANYQPNGRIVKLLGQPFGAQILDFVWAVNVWIDNPDDPPRRVVWTSQSRPWSPAINDQIVKIPENVLQEGVTYKFTVVAQTMDKVPGFPAYSVHSPFYEISDK